MSGYVYSLQEVPGGKTGGAKANNLGGLLRAGFPVPQGIVLVAEAYLNHIQEHNLEPKIEDILRTTNFSDAESIEKSSRGIQALILEPAIPQELEQELREGYRGLNVFPGHETKSVAVRSSSTLEDLEETSFAGQHTTYLNVIDEDNLISRVKDCWASLWTPRAMHYRAQIPRQIEPLAMAVVIQQMIPATASGVAFSVDPVTGDFRRMVINATWGLGEGVVTGSVNGDLYTIDKESLSSLGNVIGDKESAVVSSEAEPGTMLVTTHPAQRREPSLTSAQLPVIAGLIRDVEIAMGGPQDIEWSFHGDHPYILQSRPITGGLITLNEQTEEDFPIRWPDPENQEHHWKFNFVTSGMEQDPFVPLETDLRAVWFAGRQNALKLGGGSASRQNQLLVLNGYPYARSSNCGLSEEEITERTRQHQIRVRSHLARGTNIWEAEILPEVLTVLSTVYPIPHSTGEITQLQEYMEQVLVMYERLWTLHWLMGLGGGGLGWPEVFTEITDIDDPLSALELLQGQPNKTTELMTSLLSLVRMVQASSVLLRLFQITDERDLMLTLKGELKASDFLKSLDGFLEAFGYRTGTSLGSVARLPTPPWREEPSLVFSVIKRYLDQDIALMDARQESMQRGRAELLASIRESLKDRDEVRERFERELIVWRGQAARMENHNFYIDQFSSAIAYIAFRKLGDALHDANSLENPDDVFFLTLEDLRHAEDPVWASAFQEKVRDRQILYAWWRRLNPPAWVGSPPPSLPEEARTDTGEILSVEEPVLRGMPTVRGRHTGRARVITNPVVVPQVEKGDILVALNAGEQWTPIFPVLGALVLDEGSILQHAAIVAREYGVPAVLQCKDATRRIRDGQIITVDGALGIVELGI
jgi:phosphohistidine swiveling domain-containing protein